MVLSRDMTTGSEAGQIIRFTLPLLAGNLLQQFYNIADTIIVGRFLGDDALAAVGATGSITYFFYTLCLGLATGAGVMISQYFGSGVGRRVRSAVANSAFVTAVFGAVISVAAVLLTEPVLRGLNTPESLLPVSVGYMRIAVGGTVLVAAYNWINAVMRSLGDSKTPLVFLGVASVMNVLLDLLFVIVFGWGANGAAAATVIAQGISAVLSIIFAFAKNPDLRLSREDMRINKTEALRVVSMGVPIAAQNGMISLSMIAIQRVTNGFGEVVMASYTASMRVEQFVQQPFNSLNAALSAFTGQNIGAGKSERAVKGLRVSLLISSAFAAAVALIFFFTSGAIVGIFVSGEGVIAMGGAALKLTALFYVPLGAIHVTRGFLNGAGDTGYALANGLAEVICRITLSILLTQTALGCGGIWLTTCITWFVTALVGILRYLGGKWRKKAIITGNFSV